MKKVLFLLIIIFLSCSQEPEEGTVILMNNSTKTFLTAYLAHTDFKGEGVEVGAESKSPMYNIDWGKSYLKEALIPGNTYNINIEPGNWTVKLVDTGNTRYYKSFTVHTKEVTEVNLFNGIVTH